MRRKPSPMLSDTTIRGSNGQANKRRNPSPSIRLRCTSTNALSAKAILKVAERQNVQRELFADPQQDYSKAVDFYQHDVDWANRLILGDSLTVMSSLAHREDLAGKVQMIYIDPPYGIKFASNFQPTVFQRDVKDREQDLTREQEQIKAYRDTWTPRYSLLSCLPSRPSDCR